MVSPHPKTIWCGQLKEERKKEWWGMGGTEGREENRTDQEKKLSFEKLIFWPLLSKNSYLLYLWRWSEYFLLKLYNYPKRYSGLCRWGNRESRLPSIWPQVSQDSKKTLRDQKAVFWPHIPVLSSIIYRLCFSHVGHSGQSSLYSNSAILDFS